MNPIMKYICQLLVVLMLSSSAFASYQDDIKAGEVAFQHGNFELAVQYWNNARIEVRKSMSENTSETPRYIDISVRLAMAYKSLGRLEKAFNILQNAQNYANKIKDRIRKANVLMHLSDVYIAMRDLKEEGMGCRMQKISQKIVPFTPENLIEKAWKHLEKAESLICVERKFLEDTQTFLCKNTDVPLLAANILNRQGNMLSLPKMRWKSSSEFTKYAAAVMKYCESVQFSYAKALPTYCRKSFEIYNEPLPNEGKVVSRLLSVKSLINLVQVATQNDDDEIIKDELEHKTVLHQVEGLPNSHDKVFAFMGITQVMLTSLKPSSNNVLLKSLSKEKPKLHSRTIYTYAYDALMQAMCIAQNKEYNPNYKNDSEHQEACVNNAQTNEPPQIIHYDTRAIAYAKSYLAELYMETRRYREAIQLTQEAIYYAKHSPNLLQIDSQKGLHKELWGYYPELLFRLNWQLGKFLRVQTHKSAQISHCQTTKGKTTICDAYLQADDYLKLVRRAHSSLSQQFRNDVKKFYSDWADFVLQQAPKVQHAGEKQAMLQDAIKLIELSKVAEVRNYFEDRCLAEELAEKLRNLDRNLPNNVAVFYPLVFDDRIELLLSSNKGVTQSSHIISDSSAIREKVTKFRSNLINPKNEFSKQIAKELYTLFFNQSIIEVLNNQKIDTLIIIPHGYLRTIPFAALHDGTQFLVQKYALSTTPSLNLTDYRKPMQRNNAQALLSGLSVKVGSYSPLCNVPSEIRKIACVLKGNTEILSNNDFENCLINRKSVCCLDRKSGCENPIEAKVHQQDDDPMEANLSLTQCLEDKKIHCALEKDCALGKGCKIDILQDEDFTLSKVEKRFQHTPYSIIHFATHGNFDSDPNKTFLLTYNGKITMNDLSSLVGITKFGYQPVELLTLSACETAKGDEYAALGLAGTAIRAGVPSVLATLWKVNDAATTELMIEFYRQLNNAPSKAKALQYAQKHLLEGKKYNHPYFWTPFLLIGNWL